MKVCKENNVKVGGNSDLHAKKKSHLINIIVGTVPIVFLTEGHPIILLNFNSLTRGW